MNYLESLYAAYAALLACNLNGLEEWQLEDHALACLQLGCAIDAAASMEGRTAPSAEAHSHIPLIAEGA